MLILAGPIAVSFGVATLLSKILPRAQNIVIGLFWTALIVAISMATLLLVGRAARRLLPLAALLNLTLIFPDKAPARFAVARRTGKASDLRAHLQKARETGKDDEATRMQTVIELVLALSVHDKQSRGHSERVRVFTDLLADELKVPEAGRNRLRWAALLHDIGKLEVSPAILTKPGPPTEDEWVVLHRHPEDGARLVAPLLPWLGEWGLAVVQHHERFDGTGYPNRLKGREISQAARIVSVADVYEVMTAPRPYKRAMKVSAARAELVRVAGTQLDPVMVRAFLNISVGRLWRTVGVGAWVAQLPTLGRIFSFGGIAGSGPAMGIATAATATILGVSGFIGPTPSPAVSGPTGVPSPVALAPLDGAGGASASPRGGGPLAASGTPTGAQRSNAPPTVAPTLRPTPTPAPTPRPTATPTPAQNPWSCAACTNTGPGCTSFCSGTPNQTCTTYCTGNNNKACTSHCFGGGNNNRCLQYCDGHDPACQQDCIPPTAGTTLAALTPRWYLPWLSGTSWLRPPASSVTSWV